MGTNESAPAEANGCDPIEVLDSVEVIRRRPGMFVGDTHDRSGLHFLLEGVIDTIVDAHVARTCFGFRLTLHASGAVTFEDDGPGLSVTSSQAERLFRQIVAGSRTPRSTGFGLACANALSEYALVEIRRDGGLHRMEFRRGQVVSPLTRVGDATTTGTWIKILPDADIFSTTMIDACRVADMLRVISFLNPGLRAELVDLRGPVRRETFFSRGIDEWVALLTEGVNVYPREHPIRLQGALHGVSVDVALRWTSWPNVTVKGFANQRAVERGSHLYGLFGAFRDARVRREGLVAVVDVRGELVEVAGACRERVAGESVRSAVRTIVGRGLAESLRCADDRPRWWMRLPGRLA